MIKIILFILKLLFIGSVMQAILYLQKWIQTFKTCIEILK